MRNMMKWPISTALLPSQKESIAVFEISNLPTALPTGSDTEVVTGTAGGAG
jgi:hypothetical protein